MSQFLLDINRDKAALLEGSLPPKIYLPLNAGRAIKRQGPSGGVPFKTERPSNSVDLAEWINAGIANGTITSAGGGGALSDGDKGDITVSASGTVWNIDPDVVTNIEAANMAGDTIKGRLSTTGNPEDLTKAQVQTLLSVDDLVTLSGVSEGATNLGTFTGVTITDNVTIKTALQELESSIESNGEFRGVLADATALGALTTPKAGDSAYVTDTDTLSGGSAGIEGWVYYTGAMWEVYKLAEAGANLTYTASPTQGVVNSDTGTDATIPAGSTTNASLMLPADKTKLNFVTVTQAVDLDALEADVADLTTLTGVASNATDLGTFTGTTITDNVDIKVALQELETALEATADTSITTGTLANATSQRTVPMNNQDLIFNGVGAFQVNAASYVQGNGAGTNLASIDSDATAYIKTTVTANGQENRMSKLYTQTLEGVGAPVDGTTIAWYQGQLYRNTSTDELWAATAKSSNPDSAGTGSAWTQIETGSAGTSYTTITHNGSRITYRALSGTPVVTVDKTTPLTPVLNVSGGTIRLKEFRDTFTTMSSVNPLYTFNATWADALDAPPSNVQKIIDSSGQYDDDTTPQALTTTATTSQSVVQLNGVSTDVRLIFNWNNVE